jgi:Xaa-Pro aminopeptidase
MLTLEYCRQRQQRLLRVLEQKQLACAVLSNPKLVYYFTGALVDHQVPQIFRLGVEGRATLITDKQPAQAAVDEVRLYTGYSIEKPFTRSSQIEEIGQMLDGGPAGVDADWLPCRLLPGRAVDLTPAIGEMRRIKDPDELESIRETVRLVEAGYTAVRDRIEPGWTEYQVYLRFYQALVEHARTSVDLRGDFACGTRAIRGGGPPTARPVAPGDLYILDIFPFYQGYHCDLTRTFAVGPPTTVQREAWEVVREAHRLAERLIRPGVPTRSVYEEVRAHLDRHLPTCGSFWHHLGHGIGMNGWEFPWITPGSDQVFQAGEVIALEPAVYGECLNGGVRLERDYLIGESGVTPLDSFVLDL